MLDVGAGISEDVGPGVGSVEGSVLVTGGGSSEPEAVGVGFEVTGAVVLAVGVDMGGSVVLFGPVGVLVGAGTVDVGILVVVDVGAADD